MRSDAKTADEYLAALPKIAGLPLNWCAQRSSIAYPLPLDVIGDAIAELPLDAFLESHRKGRERASDA